MASVESEAVVSGFKKFASLQTPSAVRVKEFVAFPYTVTPFLG